MPIKPEHLDELLAGYEKPEDLLGEDGLFKQLKKALLERALGAEMTHHLGYEKGDPAGRGSGSHRNGSYPKTVLTEDGAVDLDVPRNRNSTFEPQIVPKGETHLDGFNDKIISMSARGMTVREIKTCGAFPSDEAATKLLYLAMRNLGVHWKPAIEWRGDCQESCV